MSASKEGTIAFLKSIRASLNPNYVKVNSDKKLKFKSKVKIRYYKIRKK